MNFRLLYRTLPIVIVLPIIFSCASIVSRSNWPYYLESDPRDATVSIQNKHGKEIFRGTTPTVVNLRSGAGFFSKESYVVTFSKDGFDEKKISVECKLNGWYFGNIVFGGLIGMLIVDPATGAMYKLDGKGASEQLTESNKTASRGLRIMDINKIPADWHSRLIALNP